MKNKIHYSPEALHDLDGIWDTVQKLEEFAEMGAPLSSVAKFIHQFGAEIMGHEDFCRKSTKILCKIP